MELSFQGTNTIEYMTENVRNCADCDEKNVAWCDLRYGCYLCIDCAMMHKFMTEGEEDKVKSFQCDNWTNEELGRAVGNHTADEMEENRPEFYSKPVAESLHIIKHEYIQDKYIRQMFTRESTANPHCGFKEPKSGFLYKKGKNNESWNQRYFLLQDNTLRYFKGVRCSQLKAVLQLADTDISIQSVSGKPYTLAISHTPQDEITRTYYVYGETSRETIEWYYALLATQHSLAMECEERNKKGYTIREHVKSGYMYKTGPGPKDKWKKRWVKISNSKVQYFEDETSAYPKGEFDLSATGLHSIEDGCIEHKGATPTDFTFTVKTPKRNYKFCASNQEEKVSWMQNFQRNIT